MSRHFDIVVRQDSEGFFVASAPALPGCSTQAKSVGQLMERIREAILLYLEVESVPCDREGLLSRPVINRML